MADVGEYIAGAYLKLELGCDVVDYNVRPAGGGLRGLGELDVVGYDLAHKRVFLCEVTTHIRGLLIGSSREATVRKITEKHARQKEYAADRLTDFDVRFQFWSPRVATRLVTDLAQLTELELIVNATYAERIRALQRRAAQDTYDAVNPFFRTLQILESVRTLD